MLAPELAVTKWLNAEAPLSLAGLRGRPVLIHAFQMLCPGCAAHATPQAERAHRLFRDTDLQVIGLHAVFEHHAVMTPAALEAFVREYGLSFPIGIDQAGPSGPVPVTMGRYRMEGTPSTVLVGRDGTLLYHGFGQEDDMVLGSMIQTALQDLSFAAEALRAAAEKMAMPQASPGKGGLAETMPARSR